MNWRDLKPGDRVEITLTGVVVAAGREGVGVEFDTSNGDLVEETAFLGQELDAATIRRVVTQ